MIGSPRLNDCSELIGAASAGSKLGWLAVRKFVNCVNTAGPRAGLSAMMLLSGMAWPKVNRPPRYVSLVDVRRLKKIEPPNFSVWFPKIFEKLS
jgi:hypothetical protein